METGAGTFQVRSLVVTSELILLEERTSED